MHTQILVHRWGPRKRISALVQRWTSWFSLAPSDWGIWASPLETDQDSPPGWLPLVPLDLVSPQEGFSPGSLTPRFKHLPASRILPIKFCVFSVVLGIEPLCKNTANWKNLF